MGKKINGDREFPGLVRRQNARHEVAKRVLLPVDEMGIGRQLERIAANGRTAMRCRPQTHKVRPQAHELMEAVVRAVGEGDTQFCRPRQRRKAEQVSR